MRIGIRRLIPALLVATLFLVSMNAFSAASAQELQATPIVEAEPTSEPASPTNHRSPANLSPMNTGNSLTISGIAPLSNLTRTSEDLVIHGSYIASDPWTGAGTPSALVTGSMSSPRGTFYLPQTFAAVNLNQGTFSVLMQIGTDTLIKACQLNSGSIPFSITLDIFDRDSGYSWEGTGTFQAACSVQVSPLVPILGLKICGPGNDFIFIPSQPEGVTISDSGWQGTQRAFTYTYADWVVPSSSIAPTFTDTDPPCTASVTTSAPESLPRMPGTELYGVTVDYDFGNAWPGAGDAYLVIELIGHNATSSQTILEPTGSYTYHPWWTLEDAAWACWAGVGSLSTDVTVTLYPSTGNYTDVPLWTYSGYHETDCTVAVYPQAATYIAEACGFSNDRIVVPIQGGIQSHSITWDGNVATIEYTPIAAFEIVGGPFTVSITEPPCFTRPVSSPTLDPVCGIENDLVLLPAPVEGTFFQNGRWIDGTYHIELTAEPGYALPHDQQTEFALVDPGDCEIEGLTEPIHDAVCGPNNDTVQVPEGIENVSITVSGDMAVDGSVTVTYTPDERYKLPDGISAEYVLVDSGDCVVTPVAPAVPVDVCGPDNDILAVPDQPEGLTAEDSGWINNERVIEFILAENYALAEGAQSRLTYTDEDVDCVVDPVGTTLVIRFETSDGGSLEGESWAFYAPVASQVSAEPWAEGVIEAGNTVVLEEIIAGTYRITADPAGYEPIDALIVVTSEGASEEHVIEVLAIQPVETPTEEPTTAAVTGLPETGSGSSSAPGVLAQVGLIAAFLLVFTGQRRVNR